MQKQKFWKLSKSCQPFLLSSAILLNLHGTGVVIYSITMNFHNFPRGICRKLCSRKMLDADARQINQIAAFSCRCRTSRVALLQSLDMRTWVTRKSKSHLKLWRQPLKQMVYMQIRIVQHLGDHSQLNYWALRE